MCGCEEGREGSTSMSKEMYATIIVILYMNIIGLKAEHSHPHYSECTTL